MAQVWQEALGAEPPAEIATGPYLRLSPLRHGTDCFFAACLRRKVESAAAGSPPESSGSSPESSAAVSDGEGGAGGQA